MPSAPKRQSVDTYGYGFGEMRDIERQVKQHRSDWLERFHGYVRELAADDWDHSPREIVRRAALLADTLPDEIEVVVRERFAGVPEHSDER